MNNNDFENDMSLLGSSLSDAPLMSSSGKTRQSKKQIAVSSTAMTIHSEHENNNDFEKQWRSLTIADDFIFGRVFSDEKLCKRLIEILLHVKVDSLKIPPEYQKTFQSGISAKGVRFDVYTESADKAFDIEIQTSKQKDLPLRMRYYQSSMDTSLIRKGQNFSDLKQTYVLFICTEDPFDYGEAVYEIETTIKNHPECKFNDNRKEVVYNVSAFEKLDDCAEKFVLEYIKTGEVKMDFVEEIDKKVEEIKNDEYWKNNYINIQMWKMDAINEGKTKGFEQGRQEGRIEGKIEGKLEGIQEGIEQQKAEDEKLIAQKDIEIEKQAERIRQLEKMIFEK